MKHCTTVSFYLAIIPNHILSRIASGALVPFPFHLICGSPGNVQHLCARVRGAEQSDMARLPRQQRTGCYGGMIVILSSLCSASSCFAHIVSASILSSCSSPRMFSYSTWS
ncbi:hypothetical protein I7I50_11533 [Histoplasma capsulatum G186AR]|uniref:Uncharacterized protein n=1 Tax=Ajellomyces capsulatus TaxID=5037 RepID=A0A8H7ZB02_AJECA|nr:hypothetical protein I7I52_02770 [Histoplasma capsulatum]QSS70036.1 hypothetical protein I7I50_11533 [Histoplasma capsulatum G186AR]